jgi:hypothetical protein
MASTALVLSGLGSYVSTLSSNTVSTKVRSRLGKSLSSGDLNNAETEYISYEELVSSTSDTSLASDLSSLGTALKDGNLTTAESSYASASSEMASFIAGAQVSTAKSLAEQAANWIVSLMSDDSNSSSSSLDPITALINTVYGQSDASYTSAVTAQLKSKYALSSSSSSILDSVSAYA